MTTKPGRNKTVTTECAYCGTTYEAIESRVKIGQGLFCSRTCANLYRTKGKEKKYVGKENAYAYWQKSNKRYDVYWIDPETGKRKTSTYAKWFYEVNFGEIPDGYTPGYIDGDSTNISPENITLFSKEEIGNKISQRLMGHEHSDETRKKISEANSGKKRSDEIKEKLADIMKMRWDRGDFDSQEIRNVFSEQGKLNGGRKWTNEQREKVSKRMKGTINPALFTKEALKKKAASLVGKVQSKESNQKRSKTMIGRVFSDKHIENLKATARRGEKSNLWRGGKFTSDYPEEFSRSLKSKIRKRDNHCCQACGENVYRSVKGVIHHIDANKQNSSENNLILLCNVCHGKVHSFANTNNEIIQSLQEWIE